MMVWNENTYCEYFISTVDLYGYYRVVSCWVQQGRVGWGLCLLGKILSLRKGKCELIIKRKDGSKRKIVLNYRLLFDWTHEIFYCILVGFGLLRGKGS